MFQAAVLDQHELKLENLETLQKTLAHRAFQTHPFIVIDEIGEFSEPLIKNKLWENIEHRAFEEFVDCLICKSGRTDFPGQGKVKRFAKNIFVGVLITAYVNDKLYRLKQID